MSLLASIALAASGASVPACSWDHPGTNPFMGDVVASVDHYKDIPVATREKLKARMAKRDYDEIVLIERDRITGLGGYDSQITDMHFGQSGYCKTVTRARWTDQMKERGLVYCEDGQCILVPTICRNVSRIRRNSEPPLSIAPGAGPAASPASAAAPVHEEDPLAMEAPGAGPASVAPGSFAAVTPPTVSPLGPIAPTPGGPITVPPVSPPTVPTLPPLVTLPPVVPPVTPVVPEPGTWALMLAGAATVMRLAQRRARR